MNKKFKIKQIVFFMEILIELKLIVNKYGVWEIFD